MPSFSVETARTVKFIVPLKLASLTTSFAMLTSAGVPDQIRVVPTPPMKVRPSSLKPAGTPETTTETDSEPSLSRGVTEVMAPDRPIRRLPPSTADSVVCNGDWTTSETGSATPRTSTSRGSVDATDVLVYAPKVSTETAETVSGISTLLFNGGVSVSSVVVLKLAIETLPAATVSSTPP